MACRTVVVNSLSYDYCPDELPPLGDRVQAILRGRFVDELTGSPVRTQLVVGTALEGVRARATSDAVAGLIANPARRFPGLAGNAVSLEMTVEGRRFIRQSFHADIGPFSIGNGDPADFPDYFAPADLGEVALHRQATLISGRCIHHNSGNSTPLDNVTVELAGLWHRFPAADVDPVAVVEGPEIIALAQGLYAGRTAGIDQVSRRILQPQAGEEKTLILPAGAGATELRLSDRVNLAAGQLLGVEIDHRERAEYLQVVAVEGASTAGQPATVTLAYPLRQSHRQGVSAVRVVPQSAGSANVLTRDAIPGDLTLFLDALADIDNTMVEISGSGVAEYHRVSLYSAVSDADGYYSLPPISRVAMMQLHASHVGPLADIDRDFSPDYEQFGNRVDLVFS